MTATTQALLTPPGRAAIAVVGVRGDLAPVWALFRRAGDRPFPESPAPGSLWHGAFGEPGGPRDEVMLYVRGPGDAEVQCHGGVAVVRLVQRALEARGVRVVDADAWLAGEGPDRAEAIATLGRCVTVRTAGLVLDHLAGAFAREAAGIRDDLHAGRRDVPRERVATLRARERWARRLDVPWSVVLAGAPNAGKSSLVNALAGYARSVVSPEAGTTRDVVTAGIALDGWPIALTDTAGLRVGASGVEAEGIARTRRALAEADVVVRVVDGSAPIPDDDVGAALVVVTKCDLRAFGPLDPSWLRTSARTGAGVAAFGEALVRALGPAPQPGDPLPLTAAARATLDELETATRA